MKKKPAIQFDPHDYDYLDTLDKDGWYWEFMRRNQKYRTTYDEMERLRTKCAINCRFDCSSCKVKERPCLSTYACYAENTLKIKPFFKTAFGWSIPDPSIKYSDLPCVKGNNRNPILDEAKPVTMIRPISPMKALTGNEIQEAIRQTWRDRNQMFKYLFNQRWHQHGPEDAIFDFVKQILSPLSPYTWREQNALYMSISLHATRDELRKAFQDVLKKHVRTKTSRGDTKLHPEKRKSGLMIWDIRTNHRLSLQEAGYKIDISKDAAKKQYYKTYEHIYRKKYVPAYFDRPEIKKEYLGKKCDSCPKKPTCTDLCPDVLGFVNQDAKSYQRERTFGDIERPQKDAQENFNSFADYKDELIDSTDKRTMGESFFVDGQFEDFPAEASTRLPTENKRASLKKQ